MNTLIYYTTAARKCTILAVERFLYDIFHQTMARGNQRDLARAKNQKKQQEAAKAQKKTGDPKKRMESDADKMRQKQAEGTCS